MARHDYYILDENHCPVIADLLQWGNWFENMEHRRVASTKVGDVDISTVFLGLDHQWGDGPPLLFETMVFGGPLNEEQERYTTWDEALLGHSVMVERVREASAKIEEVIRPT